MLNAKRVMILGLLLVFACGGYVFAEEKVLFGFENDLSGWEIPDWSLEKEEYVGRELKLSSLYADERKNSLQLHAKFPGGKWTAAYVEVQQYFDWMPYSGLAVDVYLPASAPAGLRGKLVLTVGESWQWVEMSRGVTLEPGKWVTISANLLAGSADFRAAVDDAFRTDVRKVGVRIESNMKPAYQGEIYLDNFRLIEKI